MPTIQQLSVKLVADDTGLKASLSEDKARAEATGAAMQEAGNKGKLGLGGMGAAAEEGGGKLQGFLGHVTGIAAGIGAVELAAQGFDFLKDQIGEMVTAGEEGNRIDAQLAAGLKATHGASGQTAASLEDLASHMLHLTGIDDDATKAAESMLLTFTNISGKTFPQATQAVADLATKMANGAVPSAQQMEQASIQLGKALNDPLHGYTALQRVGVTFTDQQKQQIKHFMAVGDVAGAQNVILKEMNHEFGGAAEAAGHANGGLAILKAQMENTKQTIGQALIPVLTGLASAFMPIVQAAADLVPAALKFLSDHSTEAKIVFIALAGTIAAVVVPALLSLLAPLGVIVGGMLATAAPVIAVGLAIAGLALLFKHAMDTSKPFHDAVMGLVGTLKTIASIILGNLKAAFDAVLPLIKQVGEWVGTHLQAAFNAILPHITAFISWLNKGAMTLGNQLGPALRQLGAWLTSTVVPALKQFGTFLTTQALPALQQLGTWIQGHILPVLQQLGALIVANVLPILGQLGAWVKSTLLPALQQLWSVVGPVLGAALGALANIIGGVVLPIIGHLWDFLAAVLLPILNLVGHVLQVVLPVALAIIGVAINVFIGVLRVIFGVIGTLLGWLGKLKDFLGGALTAAWNGLKGIVTGVWNGIAGAVKGGINTVIGFINGFIGFLDGIQIHIPAVGIGPVHTPAFDWGGLHLGKIPYLAKGGTTPSGFFVGAEDGPELLLRPGLYAAPAGSRVLNASDTAALLAGRAGGGAGMGGGGGGFGSTINITGVDANQVFSMLQRESTLLRMSGRAG